MPKIIDHKQRKEEIMEKALKVFIVNGYINTKIAQIAEGCGISRTTLYQYFKNKDDIFRYTIKYATDFLERDFRKISDLNNALVSERVKILTKSILSSCSQERELITVLVEFFIQVRKDGLDLSDRIKRRTIRIHRLFTRLFQEGIDKKEIAVEDPRIYTQVIFSFIQSFVIEISLINSDQLDSFSRVIDVFIDGISLKK